MAEWLGNRAFNQKVAGSILGHAKWSCVLGQGTSPYLPRGECSYIYCKSLWIRASAKWLHVNVIKGASLQTDASLLFCSSIHLKHLKRSLIYRSRRENNVTFRTSTGTADNMYFSKCNKYFPITESRTEMFATSRWQQRIIEMRGG